MDYELPAAKYKGKYLDSVSKIDEPSEKKLPKEFSVKNRANRIECLYDGMIFRRRKEKLANARFNSNGEIIKVTSKFEGDVVADNYNSINLGFGPIRNATRKQKYKKPPLHANIEYAINKDIFDAFECDVERAVVIDGCYRSNKYTLIRQLTPENLDGTHYKHPDCETLSKFDETIKAVIRKLSCYDMLETCAFEDVLNCEFTGEKKAGYRYEEEYGLNTKESAVTIAYSLAKKRWNYVSQFLSKKDSSFERKKIYPGYYVIGARSKRDATYENGEVPNSRVVHMPEFHCEMTSAPWCDSITEEIKEKRKGPVYIGNSILDWRRLDKDMRDSQYVIEGDWKRFDSTLYIQMITMVVAIMRTFFPLNSDYIDRHFMLLYDSLAFKDYHLVGGRFIRAFHGLPSGVKATSLINSFANLIALNYCVGPKNSKSFNFIVGGDDFLISRRRDKFGNCVLGDELLSEIEQRSSELGMQFKFLKLKYYNSDEIEDCPTFYKYTIYKGKPVVPTSSVLERCYMPWNKTYNSKKKYLKFLRDVQPSLGTPMSHLLLFFKTLIHLTYLNTGLRLTYAEVIKSHMRLTEGMFNRKIYSDYILNFFTGEDILSKRDVASLLEKKNSSYNNKNLLKEFLSLEGVL